MPPEPVPPLYCPLPTRMHPESGAIGRRSVAWLEQFGLLDDERMRDRIRATRPAEWACRIAPAGAGPGLQLVSDWTHLGFVIDDSRFDAGPIADRPGRLIPLMMRLMHALDHPEAPADDDPFAAAFRNLSARARACAPAAVVRRWADGNLEWFFSVACLTAYRVAGTMPTLTEYLNLGPRDRAMRLTGSLIELAEGSVLTDADREEPAVRAVTQAANLLVTIGNDLFSFRKEADDDVLESNIVGVIQHRDACPAEEALARTVELHDRVMCLYLGLRAQLDADGAPTVRRHLTQLDHLIRGNLEWSVRVPRYGTASASPWADTPADGRPAAPHLAPIDWWWEQVRTA
ncbi:terpene synthase family protein [Cryptosporangium japonicum]|uniref:Terpene synthase n=1 Tax=Cryptosporangium japonicum TaxID=80872 RepID=A0ABP3DVF3_9ACTN